MNKSIFYKIISILLLIGLLLYPQVNNNKYLLKYFLELSKFSLLEDNYSTYMYDNEKKEILFNSIKINTEIDEKIYGVTPEIYFILDKKQDELTIFPIYQEIENKYYLTFRNIEKLHIKSKLLLSYEDLVFFERLKNFGEALKEKQIKKINLTTY